MKEYKVNDIIEITKDYRFGTTHLEQLYFYEFYKGDEFTVIETTFNGCVIERNKDHARLYLNHDVLEEFTRIKNDKAVSKEEDEILDLSVEILTKFNELEQTHPSDIDDITNAIKDIQRVIAVRMARRTYPQRFKTVRGE